MVASVESGRGTGRETLLAAVTGYIPTMARASASGKRVQRRRRECAGASASQFARILYSGRAGSTPRPRQDPMNTAPTGGEGGLT